MDPPFITLSSTQSYGSICSSSTNAIVQDSTASNQSTAPSSPPSSPSPEPSTHNISKAKYHMKDIAEFAQTLELSANRALPNCGRPRYNHVEVLLLRWEDDELQVEWELNDLAKVLGDYGFHTETWLIPTESPLRKMMSKAIEFVEKYEAEDTLFIIYYGGHAKINQARQSTWSCKRDLSYSSFEWNGCQGLFEQSKSDVLLLLDCCCAAAAATCIPSRTISITETIGACGWETWAPEPGSHSFTNALIEVLEDWIDRKSFSAAMLHSEILSVLKQSRPRYNREISKTPVYIVTTSNPKTCSIEISRRTQPDMGSNSSELAPSSTRECSPTTGSNISVESDRFDLSTLIETLPDKTFLLPHVIVSVALETDQTLDMKSFEEWVKQFPALAKYAKIQGVYKGYSTLVLLAVPVVIWNLLPEDPACNFVGYVRTDNLLDREPRKDQGSAPEDIKVATQLSFSEKSPPVDDATGNSLHSVPLPSQLQQQTTHKHLPSTYSLIASALKELALPVKEFAFIVVDENGDSKEFTSPSLTPYHQQVFSNKFRRDFFRSVLRNSDPDPYDSEAYANSGYASDYASDASAMGAKGKINRPSFTSMSSHHSLTGWDSDSSDGDMEIFPVQKTRMMKIGDEHEVEEFYKARFRDMQQSACKVVGNAWVRLIEPRKQTHYPYTKGNISAPPWWPPTTGENKVRHINPENLLKPEIIRLLVHILRTAIEPRQKQPSTFQELGLDVKRLEEVTLEVMSNSCNDTDHPENDSTKLFLKETFKVAKLEERYKSGQVDETTVIPVMYFGSLVEEDDAEDELDDEPPTLSVTPSVPVHPAFSEEPPQQ